MQPSPPPPPSLSQRPDSSRVMAAGLQGGPGDSCMQGLQPWSPLPVTGAGLGKQQNIVEVTVHDFQGKVIRDIAAPAALWRGSHGDG